MEQFPYILSTPVKQVSDYVHACRPPTWTFVDI